MRIDIEKLTSAFSLFPSSSGAIPLVSTKSSRRAAAAVLASIVSLAAYREVEPFERQATNVLVYAAQYSILLTFGAALAIETELSKTMNPFLFGSLLCVVNVFVLAFVLAMGVRRHVRDLARRQWRPELTTQQEVIVRDVMLRRQYAFSIDDDFDDNNGGGGGGDVYVDENRDSGKKVDAAAMGEAVVELRTAVERQQKAEERLLKQVLLQPGDVHMDKKVGAGSFGEVFRGSCLGQPVAVKTMIDVTEENVTAFRREILLTAKLRHPVRSVFSVVHSCGFLTFTASLSASPTMPRFQPPCRLFFSEHCKLHRRVLGPAVKLLGAGVGTTRLFGRPPGGSRGGGAALGGPAAENCHGCGARHGLPPWL